MKHIFIINPNAGKGKAYEFIKPKIDDYCTKNNVDYEVIECSHFREGKATVDRIASSGEELRFYACGGDGTLYEIVNGAFGHENAQVTVIPLGSGNDFIRLFGSKEDFYNLDNLVNGVPCSLDVIKCGDEIAINQCSMGFDAEVCARQASFKKIPGINGELAYAASAVYSITRKVKNTFTISIDDGEPFTQDCIFCVGANSRWYGGGFMAAPKALPDDGLMDMIIVKKSISRIKLLSLLNEYKAGQHLDWPMCNFVRGKKLTIHSEKPAAVNVDGECSFVNDATFELIEKGITFVVPKGSPFFDIQTRKE
ncbi:MAG: diacylglycerol kinase family lipid kinase [Clostridia bacterium]|nr:diacylglycerol kinase family lipid kinase [Clostridia bacterium]